MLSKRNLVKLKMEDLKIKTNEEIKKEIMAFSVYTLVMLVVGVILLIASQLKEDLMSIILSIFLIQIAFHFDNHLERLKLILEIRRNKQ